MLDSGGTLTVIGSKVLNADGTANAYGMNNDGAVCGTYYKQTTGRLAVVWAGGSMQALNIARFFYGPAAYDINNNGVIVGYAKSTKVSTERAAVWPNATAPMIVLDQFLAGILDQVPYQVVPSLGGNSNRVPIASYVCTGSCSLFPQTLLASGSHQQS